MKKTLLCLAVGLLTGLSAFGAAAFPTNQCPTGNFSIDLLLTGSLSSGCFDQDKGYTDFAYTGPAGVQVRIVTLANVPAVGQDRHFLYFTPDSPWTTPFTLSYSIQIAADQPLRIMDRAVLSASIAPGASVVVTLDPDEVSQPTVNISGASASTPVRSRLINVTNSVTASLNDDVTNLTNRFDQFTVPEPATIGVIGAGLLALGALRRKKA